jgi:hypothetical protein
MIMWVVRADSRGQWLAKNEAQPQAHVQLQHFLIPTPLLLCHL